MKLCMHDGGVYERPQRPIPQDLYSGLVRAAMDQCPECSPIWTRLRTMEMGLFLYGSFYYEAGLHPLALIRLTCEEHRKALTAASVAITNEARVGVESDCLPCSLAIDGWPDQERFLLGFMSSHAAEEADLSITKTLCSSHGQERAKGVVLLGEHLRATIEASL